LLGALSMHRVIETEGRQKAAELLSDGNGNAVDDSVVEGLLAQNQSTNLYDTLRRTFGAMNRRDLSDRVGPDMDLDSLRGEFDF
jgi:peroxin-5